MNSLEMMKASIEATKSAAKVKLSLRFALLQRHSCALQHERSASLLRYPPTTQMRYGSNTKYGINPGTGLPTYILSIEISYYLYYNLW